MTQPTIPSPRVPGDLRPCPALHVMDNFDRLGAMRPVRKARLPQPTDLAFAPPHYPGHDYRGEGVIVRVVASGEFAGFLTRQGDRVGWLASAPPWTPAGEVRRLVSAMLARGAAAGVPLDDTWREVLAAVEHDEPVTGPLDGLPRC